MARKMRVSYSWLQEYVDIDMDPQTLAEALTLTGSEVASVEPVAANLDKRIVVGQIQSITAHPHADKLVVATVDVGDGKPLTVVTGAPNIKVGDKVPMALVGAVLPGGVEIRETDLRGIISTGMMCSELELELGDDASGIMILPQDAPIGESVAEALQLDDTIIDLEIYPNRPDCLSVIGIAREVAAITRKPLRLPKVKVTECGPSIDSLASVEVKDPDLCPRYTARVIRNVKVGPSPLWLQQRVRAGGMRPINNVVDITNYVMLEMGQPLHAFDYDKLIQHKVVVRRALPGETMVTLDDQERDLPADTLVIADIERAVCVAGVMGAANTEVTEATTNIFLESANFQGASIRQTSRRMGLRSEASARFEKGLDPELTVKALDRAASLLAEVAGGEVCPGIIDVNNVAAGSRVVKLRPERCTSLLGMKIPLSEMVAILRSLEFGVTEKDGCLEVEVPSHRLDIELEADLIEEVVRLYGYDKIPATLPRGVAGRGGQPKTLQVADLVRDLLVGAGLTEVMTYSFDSPRSYDRLGVPEDHELRQAVTIRNPLTEDWSIMRTTLIPHLLDVLQHNAQRQQQDLRIFEIAAVYRPHSLPVTKQPQERQTLGIALMGEYPRQWGIAPRSVDFFDLKGLVEMLCEQLGLELAVERCEYPGLHPGKCARIIVNGQKVGIIGEVHPEVADKWELPVRAYVAELDLEQMIQNATWERRVETLPRYPAVSRDLAVLAATTTSAGDIARVIAAAGGELVKEVRLFDLYQGEQIPAGYRSLAYSITYQAVDRTLTDEEITAIEERIINRLHSELSVTRR